MSDLKPLIIQEIKRSGAMPVDRYMELCLSHPLHGYYMKKDPFGLKGDFTTAPEISQIFGEMVALWLVSKWQQIGSPREVALIELGPGRGTLMADILRTIKIVPKFQPQVHLVEISPVLIKLQKTKLKHSSIFWHNEIPKLEIPSIIIANEFFDALPIKQFVGTKERKIVVENEQLAFNMLCEDGLTSEVCESALHMINVISKSCVGGIIVDYGYNYNEKKNTLQAVEKHKYVSVLEKPGDADITAHADFGSLGKVLDRKHIITTQREFLLQHGAALRAQKIGKEADLQRLIDPAEMGELFKVLCF